MAKLKVLYGELNEQTLAAQAEALQKALDKSVGKAWLGNRPEQQPNQTGPEAEKKKGEADRGRNRGKSQEGEKKE